MKLVFVGDSLTEWFDWGGRFPGHRVLNLGIAGETVDELLRRIADVIKAAEGAQVIFLMTGINNIAMEDLDILDSWRDLVSRIISSMPDSVLVIESLLPVDLEWVDNRIIADINNSLQGLAKEFNAAYLDIFNLFLDKSGRPATGCLSEDGVHLAERGYGIWAGAVEEYLGSFSGRKGLD